MEKLESHKIERAVVEEKTRISVDFLDSVLGLLDDRPDLLPTVFRREIQVAAGTGDDAAVAVALTRAARVAALLFVHARAPGGSTFIALDDRLAVSLAGEIDPSFVNAPAWIEGMWCALAIGDGFAQQWLATVPASLLEPQGSQHGRHAFALVEFLRSLVTRDGRQGQWLADAMALCDAGDDARLALTRDWVDQIELPALDAAFHLLDRDETGFNRALAELHAQHRKQWQSGENRLAVDGLVSLRGCALRRLAAEIGIQVTVDSGYLPSAIWAHAPSWHALHCPYCVTPLADEAPACGPCGHRITDAPLELAPASMKKDRVACASCDFPLHALAVVCPRCRTPRRKG